MRDPYSYAVVEYTERRQIVHLELLRTFPEGLPVAVIEGLGRPIYGMNGSLAQRISVTGPGAFWLVPANRHLCIVARRSAHELGTACATTERALARGMVFVDVDPGPSARPSATPRLIVGVAPDRVGTAVIRTHGSATTVPVDGNAFVLRDAVVSPPDLVTLR